MRLPQIIQDKIEKIARQTKSSTIASVSKEISDSYRKNIEGLSSLIDSKQKSIAYVVSRMPATYTAVYSVLSHSIMGEEISSFADVGAGSGAGIIAINQLGYSLHCTAYELSSEMIEIGKQLCNDYFPEPQWKQIDVTRLPILSADLVLVSYVINEISPNERKRVITELYQKSNKFFIVIEPGTPQGFKNILEIRETLKNLGGHIIAPCTNQEACPISSKDWCHFSERVERTSLHKQCKSGKLSYEDEKFCYIAFSKIQKKNPSYGRILRHPIIKKGNITFCICRDNKIENKTLSKKDGERYKQSKKLKWGDEIF